MEIVFVRHGQGEHTLKPPESLQIHDPSLTKTGIRQAQGLSARFPLEADDILIASPTRRTIQTALHWKSGSACRITVHPAVGPRMFPLLPAYKAWPCDKPLPIEKIRCEYPHVHVCETNTDSWDTGINAIEESLFHRIAEQFIRWCVSLNRPVVFILSHDGTITAYRRFLGETTVTRKDFLGETGAYRMKVPYI